MNEGFGDWYRRESEAKKVGLRREESAEQGEGLFSFLLKCRSILVSREEEN